jgi:hypothetical protein
LTCRRTFVTFPPSSNTKERCMKFLAITIIMGGFLVASGCRHDYNPAPPPYPCQPACQCQPACAPAYNQCAPSTNPYLTPTPNNIPARNIPYNGPPAGTTNVAPPAGGYSGGAAGGYPGGAAGAYSTQGTNSSTPPPGGPR